MSEPRVCVVMLTKDRPQLLKRALASCRAQTYKSTHLLLINSGEPLPQEFPVAMYTQVKTIGELRNKANDLAVGIGADIIAHFDDDDWSHPGRLAEQVAFLQDSGAGVVGYSDLLFWNTLPSREQFRAGELGHEAWLFRMMNKRNMAGASLCYWRETWQRVPFDDRKHVGEDTDWSLRLESAQVKTATQSSVSCMNEPRLIAGLHGGNTSSAIQAGAREWKRVPQFDKYCKEKMAL